MSVAMPRMTLALAFLAAAGGAEAGGPGRGGFHPGSFHGAWIGRAGHGFGFARRLPPISGTIHEARVGAPYITAYGHTATAFPYGARPYGGTYGHVRTGYARLMDGRGFRALAAGRLRGRGFGYGGYGFGAYGSGGYGYGAGYGYGGGLGYGGAPESYGDAGAYGGRTAGAFGGSLASGAGTTATQGVYGSGPGVPYLSEEPLAVRFAEPPLAPSPYAGYSPDDRYAYAASEDVGPGPRVIALGRARPGCGCGPRRRAEPVFYRYGVGTAY